MESLFIQIIRVTVTITLLYVWIVNFSKVKNDFKRFQLPMWIIYPVGFIKILISLLLIVITFYKDSSFDSLIGLLLTILMLSAFILHLKNKSSVKQWLPSFILLLLSVFYMFQGF